MLSIQSPRADRLTTTSISLCCALRSESNKDAFSCSVFIVQRKKEMLEAHELKNYADKHFGLIKFGMAKYEWETRTTIKDSKIDAVSETKFLLWTTEYNKGIY
jgi:hypothetical protein